MWYAEKNYNKKLLYSAFSIAQTRRKGTCLESGFSHHLRVIINRLVQVDYHKNTGCRAGSNIYSLVLPDGFELVRGRFFILQPDETHEEDRT
jgi:hypothetical protein